MSLENKYFAELARRLRAAGITAGHPEKNRLTVLLNNQPVLSVSAGSDVFLLPAGSNQPEAGELYHKVAQTADEVYAYVEAVQTAPLLHASGLSEKFHLLADFGGAVLAGRELENGWGYQFVTWIWDHDRTGVSHGHYYEEDFQGAKQDFAVRSGLISKAQLFSPEELTQLYGLSYPEAMIRLLGGEQGVVYEASPRKKEPEPKEFALPPAGESMRRVYAYLLKQRFISREVLNTFVSQRLIYESCEKSKDNTKEYHNAVFVGFDEHGVPRHAHKRGVYTHGKSYRGNVSGCDPRYSFHWTGSSDRLYVFEAPIDLLSFLTLYPQDWQKHSYVALCGTSEHAMLWMLEQNPQIRKVALCLDHDEAGIEASGQHEDTLRERGIAAAPLRSQYKDWNADLKALHGLPAEPAEEHPQLLAADPICQRIGAAVSSGVAKPEQAEQKLPILLQDYKNHLHQGRFDRAMDAMELAAAMALSSALREFRQMGKVVSPQQGAERLRQSIQPHHNRGSLKNRADEIAMELQRILAQKASAGICGRESKESLAYRWLELAASCAKVPIRYEADQIKQRQKEEQAQRGAGPVME